MKKYPGFILVFFFLCQFLPAQTLDHKILGSIKSSLVYIQVNRKICLSEKEFTTTGTGFFISRSGHVLTAWHVVQPYIPYESLNYPAPVSDINVIMNSGTKDQKCIKAGILIMDKTNDLAVLTTGQLDTPFLELKTMDNLIETTPVWVFGYPFGETFSIIQRGPETAVTTGTITALRHDDKGILMSVQIDAAVNPGNSGGPLVDQNGNVLGIINSTFGAEKVNFAIPLHFALALKRKVDLADPGVRQRKIRILSFPDGASVFIDGNFQGKTPLSDLDISEGLHSFVLVRDGFETWMCALSITTQQVISSQLEKNRYFPINLDSQNEKVKEEQGLKDEKSFQIGRVLLIESFENVKNFESWQQSTGGNEKRTWFLEKGCLNQYDSDELLHALYLGDESWKDYSIKADVKISDTHDDSRAGLIFRDTDDGFYLFRIHKESDKAQLAYHCKNPFGWFILQEKKLPVNIGDDWYALNVQVSGSSIRCFLNGQPIFSTHSILSGGNGRIGFYSVESKASFDNLQVNEIVAEKAADESSLSADMLSFWYTDFFNLASGHWIPGISDKPRQLPVFFSDGGCTLVSESGKRAIIESGKYSLADFLMDLHVSLGKGTQDAEFQIIFRKKGDDFRVLRFSKKNSNVTLVDSIRGQEKIISEQELPEDFFDGFQRLQLTVEKNTVKCRLADRVIFSFKGKTIPADKGTIAFTVRDIPAVFHQLTLSSVPKEKE